MIRLTVARYYTPTGRSIQKPYVNGNQEQYNHDLIDRYNRGELMSADSIHFPDSMKYNTLETNASSMARRYHAGCLYPGRHLALHGLSPQRRGCRLVNRIA